MGAISQKRVATLLRKAQTARTTKAQGDAFENLLCYVFEQVPGIVVSRRNQRNNSDTEELAPNKLHGLSRNYATEAWSTASCSRTTA
jgi:hypothetical protein